MQKNISEKDLRDILGADLAESAVIDARLEETYEIIRGTKRRPRNNHAVRKALAGFAAAAALFVMLAVFSVMNPVLASGLPIVGGLFSKLSGIFSFGRIPQEETVVLYQEPESGNEETVTQNEAYRKTSGDITVTLTEQYADNQSVFIGIQIKNEQEFPEMMTYADGTQNMAIETEERYSFRTDVLKSWRQAEGKFVDAHTFEGIVRIDYSEINADDRKYLEAAEQAEEEGMPMLTDENYFQYIEIYEIPETFELDMEIKNVAGTLKEPLPVEGTKPGEELEKMTNEEWAAYMNTLPKEYSQYPNKYENWWQQGSWAYDLAISKKDSASRTIELNEADENGIGIRSIELSSVEMTLNVTGKDTFAVALDADGNKIENGSSNCYELAIAGHDISKVYIYICDYDEYMDGIKGYGVPGNKLGRDFQEVLEERALFKTVVDTE